MRINNSSVAARIARIRQRGLTLIETAMVLAILAIVVGGIMWVYTNAEQSRKATQSLNQLATIQQVIRSLNAGQSDYSGINAAALINTNSLPASMISGTTIRHVFNGPVTISGTANAGGGANSGFSIAFANIPKDVCSKLLATDLGRGNYSAGATTIRTQPNLPFTPTTAAASCAGATNTVTWIFS